MIEQLFPGRCGVCDGLIKGNDGVCETCRRSLPYVGDRICMKCGKPVSEDVEYCSDCRKWERCFHSGRAVFLYDEKMREAMGRFKYQGRCEYASFYGEQIVKCLGEQIRRWNVQALIPVPLHDARRRRRGYNQAELLAVEVGKRLNIPVLSDYVTREKKTAPQKELDFKERNRNLAKAFQVSKEQRRLYPHLKRVIIIDDIYTTGSTVHNCTKCLLDAGISLVYFVSVCIGENE